MFSYRMIGLAIVHARALSMVAVVTNLTLLAKSHRSFLQKLRDEHCKHEHIFYCEQPMGLLQEGVLGGGKSLFLLTQRIFW